MKTAFILAAFLLSGTVDAQPYIVGGINTNQVSAAGQTDHATLINIGAGYRVGKFAGEAACIGRADCSVSGVVAFPVAGGLSLIGKAGAHYLRGSIVTGNSKPSSSSAPGPLSAGIGSVGPDTQERALWSGWSAGAGIGAQYDFGKVGVRFMLEQTGSVGPLERTRSLGASLLLSF
jgi:hypothetical protein